jgi:hypothetical protein
VEDYLKILNVEYLSNRLSDHTEIINLSWDDQKVFYTSLKWWPAIEDNLKILKGEYLSSHFWDHNQILNLSLDDQQILKMKMTPMKDEPRFKDDLKVCRISLISSEGKFEEISSVTLLSPAC